MRVVRRNPRVMIYSLAATMGAALAPAGHAAGQSRLPIEVGDYYADSPDDCGGPAALTWDGQRFLADYVYIDNIIAIKAIGGNQYQILSRTKTKDEGTAAHGYVWRARVAVVDKGQFVFNQYADGEKYRPEEGRTYHHCGK